MLTTTALALSFAFMPPPTPTQTKNFLRKFAMADVREYVPVSSETTSYFAAVSGESTITPAAMSKETGLDPFQAVEAELNAYLTYPKGWDGVESEGAKWADIQLASSLLQHLPAGIPLPKPMLSASGEIGFYWNSDHAFIDAMIDEDGTFSIFAKVRGEQSEERFFEGLRLEPNSISLLSECLSLMKQA